MSNGCKRAFDRTDKILDRFAAAPVDLVLGNRWGNNEPSPGRTGRTEAIFASGGIVAMIVLAVIMRRLDNHVRQLIEQLEV